ncbi:MAG: FAD-binding and (Fe-S)-binding domain-containing protein, partial [Candidatus Binataceae bacterium]
PRTWPGAEDAAVAPARLGEYLRRFDAMLKRHALVAATYYGHFGEGCVHARISFDLATRAGIAIFRSAMEELGAIVAEFGGSLSGEHGDGIARSELLPMMYPREIIGAFREFKRAFDPDVRMNPGVIVDPLALDSHLKQGAGWNPRAVATHLDFASEGGLAGAALKCVGIGKCRKTGAGAMCPSYMVTREEMHSTRGRARIILEALSGDTLSGGFTDPALKEALDLCLACKACKGECPSGVDMAAYRAEFFSHYYAEHRRPLAAHFFGRMHEFARAAAPAAHFINALAHAPLAGSIARRALGIHHARELPRFAARTFTSWFASRGSAKAPQPDAREVILFPDTFNNFFEPEVAIAAVEVLERAGFRVTLPARDVCCGRPLYDQGMLGRAKRYLASALEVLAPAAERGVPIIGLEPSCILTFRDELPSMFPRDARAAALTERSMLLGEFLAREAPSFAPPAVSAQALLHGHCHQQALAGIGAETSLLARAGGLELSVLDAGCCGMAGAFGYNAEHYDVSRAAGERVLAPAIRQSPDTAMIIADGFSCRTQIRHLCPGRRPIHLAQMLNSLASGRSD